MLQVYTKEVSALVEEEKSKLLHIALIDDQEQNAIEGVLPDVLGDAVVEESPEDQQEDGVGQENERQLVEEKIKVVGEKTHTVLVLVQQVSLCVVMLVVDGLNHSIVGVGDSNAKVII